MNYQKHTVPKYWPGTSELLNWTNWEINVILGNKKKNILFLSCICIYIEMKSSGSIIIYLYTSTTCMIHFWQIFVSFSWTRLPPSCDASPFIASGPRTVGCGPYVLHGTQCWGHGQSKRHRTRQKIQPDGSSDTHIWLWDPSLHFIYNL